MSLEISALSSESINLKATLSSIQDTNLAETKMDLSQSQMQQQIAISMLNQAIQAPKQILDLLA